MDIVTAQQQTPGSRRLFSLIFFVPSAIGYLYILFNNSGLYPALILLSYLSLGWYLASKYGKKENVLFCSIVNGYIEFDKTSIIKKLNTKVLASDIAEIIISKNKYEDPMAHIYLKSGQRIAIALVKVKIESFQSFIKTNCPSVIFNSYVQNA